jgi:GNAT superfamily N-acetyltransferase
MWGSRIRSCRNVVQARRQIKRTRSTTRETPWKPSVTILLSSAARFFRFGLRAYNVPMTIREASEADWPAIWALFRAVCVAGDVFAYDADTSEEAARKLWVDPPSVGFVAEEGGQLLGTYFLRPNQPGRGNHVANGGYMVAEVARGRGVASAMCEHSIQTATRLGYRAMQFNFVVSTNDAAVRTWRKHGFAVAATLPAAFRHPTLGFVDVFIMFRSLPA